MSHVIICGLGHVGFRSFELLDAAGFEVAVITDRTSDDWRKKVERAGGKVVVGDARSDQHLVEAGIEKAFAVLAVTDQDLVNVSVVMDARRMNPQVRIVCRLFDTNLGKHISESFGVAQVFSTSELAAPVFVESLSKQAVEEGGIPIVRTARASARREGVWAKINQTLFTPSLTKYRRVAAGIAVVMVVAASVIKGVMGLTWIDSLYFVTTTITTVGYGDFNFSATSPAMKVFGILLMLVGASSLAILFSAVAEAFLSDRLSTLFGGKPVPRRGHVILVGAGHIGARVADYLMQEGRPVVVIDNDRTGRFPADTKFRVAVVEGDPSQPTTLQRAKIESAEAILAVSENDVDNLSVALSAKTLNPKVQSVVRVFDAELGEKLQSKLGLQKVLSVSGNAAPYFVAALLANGVKAAVRRKDQLVFVAEAITHPAAKPVGTAPKPFSTASVSLAKR